MTGVVWFRSDLRVDDNRSLLRAATECDHLVCLFVDPQRHDATGPLAIPRQGRFRRQFLNESLRALDRSLVQRGSRLLIRRGAAAAALIEIAHVCGGIDRLYVEDLPTVEERREVARVAATPEFAQALTIIDGRTLYPRASLPWPVSEMPLIFTSFWKALRRETHPAAPVDAPETLPSEPVATRELTNGQLPDGAAPTDRRMALDVRGGEAAAWARLNSWMWERDLLRRYRDTRNGLLGEAYASHLSPWLAAGCISARRVAAEVERYERERVANDSTEWLVYELGWRDYYHLLADRFGAALFRPTGPMDRERAWSYDEALFRTWCRGETGERFVDAAMHELAATGHMSNRARQVVASYLAHDLGVVWTWGAAWFEHLLIDYDPASNWGNWSYVAGVGTDPRRDRRFDPVAQAEHYDGDGAFRSLWSARR